LAEYHILHLDEAREFVKDPYQTSSKHPFILDHDSGDEGTSKKRKAPKQKKGTFHPKHSQKTGKYGNKNIPLPIKRLLKKQIKKIVSLKKQKVLQKTCIKLMAKSIAKSTWNRYNCAYKLWLAYKADSKTNIIGFPKYEKIGFICWCKTNKSLKATTISMYISALEKIHNLCTDKNPLFANALIKGIKNRESNPTPKRNKTTPVDFALLENIQEKLKSSLMSKGDRKVLWTVCIIAFWGCFRLGEILPKGKTTFDRFSDLLGADVCLRGGKLSLNLKSTKTRGTVPVKVSLSKIDWAGLCPVHAMKSLKKFQKHEGTWSKKLPVFRTENGANLSKHIFLKEINALFQTGDNTLTGKSFRCGIPTLLSKFNNIHDVQLIKAAGRWKSTAFRTYIVNNDGGIENFDIISKLLLKEFHF